MAKESGIARVFDSNFSIFLLIGEIVGRNELVETLSEKALKSIICKAYVRQ